MDTAEEAPNATEDQKKPDRTISTDTRAIADMGRRNVGFPVSKYYPVRAPSVESVARLLASMTTPLPGLSAQMDNGDIASAFRLLRLRPSLPLLMCTELAGGFLGRSSNLVLIYLAIPFGRVGAPANFPIFGGSVTRINGEFRTGRQDSFLPSPFYRSYTWAAAAY